MDKKLLLRIVVTALLLLAAWLVTSHVAMPLWAQLCVYLIPYLLISYDVMGEAAEEGIKEGNPFNEDFLMCVATIGALCIGFLPGAAPQFPEAVFVMLFFQVGELFEDYAEDKSRRSISAMMDIRPDTANVVRDGQVSVVDPSAVGVGETVVVKPGEKVPMDGTVLEGDSSLNTVALTGESVPRGVHAGDSVISGCINLSGVLKVRVDKTFGDSTASKIIRLVEESGQNKSKSETFIRRFARVYTPIVVFLALAFAFIPPFFYDRYMDGLATWAYRALSFLVVSCPCALVISVPLSFFGGIGGASRKGILIKGGNYMDTLSKLSTVVFDKTGTLTKGVFKVQAVHHAAYSETDLLHLAAHVERYSTHPIAQSIVTCANEKGLSLPKLTSMQEIAGHGVKANLNGEDIYVGNEKLLALSGISVPSLPENKEVGTDVYVAKGKTLLGRITISDAIKSDTIEGIQDLKALDITPVMLTGDNEKSAKAIGSLIGIENIHAGLLPEDKLSEMQKVRKEIGSVLFVGDGINDAPVLAGADVGAAMGSGADAAIEAADVVFLNSNALAISKAVRVARKVIKTAWENVAFALIVKIAVMIMGLLGYANMWVAVFADTGVTILCILYAVRLLRVKI